ncbi:MAG: NAD(P)/FAD-dependent oxidoreductase [Pyrinomonadaceae bacterium]
MSKVAIIGAGLAGSLLAIYLAKRGIAVDVYEARGDMRLDEVAAGRSINLALSDRGIAALREVGMDAYMLAEAVPMYGRMIHSVSGETKLLPYSGRKGEYINSVSRAGLNIALINEAEKYDGIRFYFNEPCTSFDCATGDVTSSSGQIVTSDTVIATDGAGSAVRQSIERQSPDFEASSVFLDHGYKELYIPPPVDRNQVATALGSDIEVNALHIWPRHQFMMIALPNFDGSFTCTLFLAHESAPPAVAGETHVDLNSASVPPANAGGSAFDSLTDESSVLEFFNREFPDAVPLMPTLIEDFFENPTGDLGTLKCWPWNVDGKALLLGDAAHAMVPFYGQGMNCAFEDVRVLAGLIDDQTSTAETQRRREVKTKIDWQSIFEEYGTLRKPNTDAIQDMAVENFYEMRDAVADPVFVKKRALETKLEQTYPDYFSKYSMVTFREDLPYSTAKTRGNAQDDLLMQIFAETADTDDIDLDSLVARLHGLKT